MPRQRFIWPSIWTSENFMELSHRQRLLFIGIFSLADDEGRIKISSKFIKASIFPCDKISTMVIEKDLVALFQKKFIVVYKTNEGDVAYIPTWKKYQKPKYPQASKLPEPTEENEARFRESSVNVPPELPNDSSMGRDGLGRDGLGRVTLGGNSGKISEEENLISEFEKEQNSESEINSQKCGASNPKNGENSKVNSEVKDSKTKSENGSNGNQQVKTLPSLPSGVDFTDLKIPAKLTNLVNTINYSSISSKPPFLDLGKLRDEILSGILPSLHRGNFDKVDRAKIAEKWNEGITTGEEWMQFFTEISLSTFLQGKKKIPNKNNGECYKTSFSYCIDHFGEILSGKWRDTPEDTEDIMDSYEKFFGPQVETFNSDDAIECQEYTAREV